MEKLPKIAVQRLRATAKPEVHPDPDLLAAFAEKSLGERERVTVLEHLALCGDCREIVALARPQPEMELVAAASAATPAPVRSGWLRGPIFRWAALAACAVVVATGGFTLRRQSIAKRTVAVKEGREPESLMGDQKLKTLDRQAADQETLAQQDQVSTMLIPAPPPVAQKQEKITASSRAARSLGGIAQKKLPEERGQGVAGGLMERKSAPTEAAASSVGLMAKAAKPAEASNQQQQGVQNQQQQSLQTDQVQVFSGQNETVTVEANPIRVQSAEADAGAVQANLDKAKESAPAAPAPVAAANNPPPAQGVAGFAATGRNLAMLKSAGRAPAVAPRWSLSSDGMVLLRSLDAGKTWQAVAVADKVVLRAVSALGPEVWVGGSGGSLYHSSTLGRDWKKVEPAADGKILLADIVAIEFTDAQHGKLTTASHEVWTTSDAGQTWQLSQE